MGRRFHSADVSRARTKFLEGKALTGSSVDGRDQDARLWIRRFRYESQSHFTGASDRSVKWLSSRIAVSQISHKERLTAGRCRPNIDGTEDESILASPIG